MGDRPWDENEGKFDVPSSRAPSAPAADARPTVAEVRPDPLERYHGVESIRAMPSAEMPAPVVIEARADADRSARPPRASHGVEMLRGFIDRMERLIDERKGINEALGEVRAEAKQAGYNVEAIQAVIKRRADPDKDWDTLDALIALYVEAVGSGGAGLDPLLDMARDAGLLARATAAPAPAKRKPSAKDLQLAEALGWATSNRVH